MVLLCVYYLQSIWCTLIYVYLVNTFIPIPEPSIIIHQLYYFVIKFYFIKFVVKKLSRNFPKKSHSKMYVWVNVFVYVCKYCQLATCKNIPHVMYITFINPWWHMRYWWFFTQPLNALLYFGNNQIRFKRISM